jgi:hypothetical protein
MVFALPRAVSRAIRVLLTCLVLSTALPAATARIREDISASVASVTGAVARIRLVRLCVAQSLRVAKAPPLTAAARYAKREPARPRILANEIRVQARRAFLLNCSWLC